MIGFDLSSDPATRAAMERAQDMDELATTGRIRMLHGPPDQFGIRVLVPVYRRDEAHDTLATRRDDLQGFVTAVSGVRDLAELSLVGMKPALVNFWLYDEAAAGDERLLYQH